MNEFMTPFLCEGLSVYAEARATITFFEEEIAKLLMDAVGSRENWPFLESRKISQAKSDKGIGQNGYWVAMDIEGLSPHRKDIVMIDCGVWWNVVKNENPIIYASFTGDPKNGLQFLWPKKEQKIKSFDKWNRTFLYLPGSKSADIGDSLNQLLDELLKQLK